VKIAYEIDLAKTPAGRYALAGALAALSDSHDWTSTKNTPLRSIALARVLSEAWNPGRLETCATLLAEGKRAPAIKVVGYRVNGRVWYTPSDGNHRAEAARNAGRARIRADVGGEYAIPLDLYMVRREIEGERLYRRDGEWARLVLELRDDTAETLVRLGVPRGRSLVADTATA
jgi:hypothetical protein